MIDLDLWMPKVLSQGPFGKFVVKENPRFKYDETKTKIISSDPNVEIIEHTTRGNSGDDVYGFNCIRINEKYYSVKSRMDYYYDESGKKLVLDKGCVWHGIQLRPTYNWYFRDERLDVKFETELSNEDRDFVIQVLLELHSLFGGGFKTQTTRIIFSKKLGLKTINYEVIRNA